MKKEVNPYCESLDMWNNHPIKRACRPATRDNQKLKRKFAIIKLIAPMFFTDRIHYLIQIGKVKYLTPEQWRNRTKQAAYSQVVPAQLAQYRTAY